MLSLYIPSHDWNQWFIFGTLCFVSVDLKLMFWLRKWDLLPPWHVWMIIINKYVRSGPLSGLVHLLLEYIGYYQHVVNYTYGQNNKKNFLEPSGTTFAAHGWNLHFPEDSMNLNHHLWVVNLFGFNGSIWKQSEEGGWGGRGVICGALLLF